MKRSYWEKIAPTYGDEIFDVLHNDKKALIRSVIKKYASKNKTAIDIGCAIGKHIKVNGTTTRIHILNGSKTGRNMFSVATWKYVVPILIKTNGWPVTLKRNTSTV